MEKRLLILFLILPLAYPDEVTVDISNTAVPGQAEDMRIGVHIGNTATRYSTNMYNNFIGNGDFEDDGSWDHFPYDDMWNHDVPGMTFGYDTTDFYDGKQSLKVSVNSQAVGDGVGQWASNKEYQDGREYVFSCYLKQEDMASGDNAQLQVHFFDTGSNCPGGYEAHEDFAVSDSWEQYEFTFTMDKDCYPRDPAQGGANTKRINLLSEGTLYIDRCVLYDKEQMTPWGLNKEFLELLKDLNPQTIRYGALDVNELDFGDMVGPIWGRTKDRAGIAEYLQLAKLVGANPDLVLPVVYSDQDYENLMEYVYGDADTEYGQLRELQGYQGWDFDKFYFELGNELMCRSTSMSSPGSCEWPGSEYGDWSTPVINLFKDNEYWDADRDRMAFNVWYDSSKLNVPLLETESGNANGGRADMIMPAKYFGGHNAFSISESGAKIDYTDSQLVSNTDLYFNYLFGTAEMMKTFAAYFDELTAEKYGKVLDFGIYEYGPSGYPDGKSTALFNLEKTLAFGTSWLDMSVALKEQGAEAINLFYYQGSFGRYSWAIVDAYPYEKKRPAYYMFKMYGNYIRGEMLERSVDSPLFDPFGPGADQYNSYGCSRGGSGCENSDYGLTDWKYPVDVPLVEVYPFNKGNRYSFLIINRDLHDAHDVALNLPYAPASHADMHFVTGNNPTLNNEDSETVSLSYETIDDFSDGYTVTVQPFSAYVLVNYADGADACLDDDNDGYPDNQYEDECNQAEVDCQDFNEFVYPGNDNEYCDCDDSDGFYIGGFEVADGIDNDCDGSVDNSPIQRCTSADRDYDGEIDNEEMSQFIVDWLDGDHSLEFCMEVISKWKEGC